MWIYVYIFIGSVVLDLSFGLLKFYKIINGCFCMLLIMVMMVFKFKNI